MLIPIDDDERQELLRELILERFGPVPYWEAAFRPRLARRSVANRRRVPPGRETRREAA